MAERRNGWHRLKRRWTHSDPALRWLGRLSVAGYIILLALLVLSLIAFDALATRSSERYMPILVGAVFCLDAPLNILLHVHRVRRMSGGGGSMGLAGAADWAIRNGDLAIRTAYATLAVCAAALIFGLFQTMRCASVGTCPDRSSHFPVFLLLLLAGSGARLLATGYMGEARALERARLNRPAVAWIAGWALALGTVVSMIFIVGSTLILRRPSAGEMMFLFGAILAILPVLFPVFLLMQRQQVRNKRRKELLALMTGRDRA